jgi:hypothetical protein
MTLTIELTPEEEARLKEEAQRAGVDAAVLAHRLIVSGMALEADDERQWQEEFRRNHEVISELAEEALRDFEQGKTVPLQTFLTRKG